MTTWFPGRQSIRHEILMLLCASSVAAILFVVAVILVRDFFSKRESKARQFTSVAGVMAENLTVAVSFRESDVAAELLQSLASESSISSALAIDEDGLVVASYGDVRELTQQIILQRNNGDLLHQQASRYDGDTLTVQTPIVEFGEAIGSLHITADTSNLWLELSRFARDTSLTCVVVLFITVAASRHMLKSITEPILALADTAREVSEQEDYAIRVTHPARGEVAVLRDQFNLMLSRLESSSWQVTFTQKELLRNNQLLEQRVAERTQELADEVEKSKEAYAELQNLQGQLTETARSAGMAEIANGVLHNIGNVLNSVNVAAQLSLENVRSLPINKLDRVALLLQEKKQELGPDWTNFEGMAALPDLLLQLANALNSQRESVSRDLRQLEEHIEFVKQIVQSQQSFSRQGGMLEEISAPEVFETACKFVASGNGHADVRIQRQFDFNGQLRTDKGKLLQILSNYIKNGLEAVRDAGQSEPTLVLATRRIRDDMIEFSVTDNGLGIDAADIDSIFRHGFTTKSDGHGFGLHSAACAAKEMHGGVAVHSDGPGRGARFCVRVPLDPVPADSTEPAATV